MTCEEARDLLLDRASVDAELRSHLDACAECADAQEEMVRIDAWAAPLRSAPVPPAILGRRSARPGSLARLVPLLVAAAMLLAISAAVVTFKPSSPAPAAQDDAIPFGGLALRSRVERERFEFQEPITFTASFRNVSDREIVFYRGAEPDRTGFPTMRITGAGREWSVYVAPFQTMVTEGILGSLETLKPGATMDVPVQARYFTWKDRQSPQPLPEGEYTVVAVYEKPDPTVEYNVGFLNRELRNHEGLWTGAVSSVPVKFKVGAPKEPVATIEPPENGTQVMIALANAPDAPLVLNGRGRLSVNAKAYGNGTADFLIADGKQLAPGETWVFPVDLAELAWTSTDGTFGISEIAPNGGWIDLTMETDRRKITTAGRLVSWSVNTATPENLALGLEMKAPLDATLKLTNTGTAPALVNKRLAYAAEVAFRLTDPEGRKPSGFSTTGAELGLMQRATLDLLGPAIVEGLSWSQEAVPKRSPLEKADFIALAPGASIQSGYNLATLVHGGIPKGSYRLQAVYLNLEPGVRLGLKGAVTGKVTSNPVDVVVR